jgi:rRNA-processing protein FCF1
MKQIILDTSFIITAIKNKIDFFEQLVNTGFQIIIPEQVIQELQGLKAEVAIKVINANKFKKIDLKIKNTDNGIMKFAKAHPKVVVATLDQEIKRRIPNQKMVIRGTKKLEVV